MSPKISLLAGLIGIAATIPIVQSIAVAKTSVEIGETARAITVLITEPNSIGSGVILQQQGDVYTVLTAAHVVRNKVDYKITTSDDRQYSAIGSSIKPAPGNVDLAVVKFRATAKYPTAKLGNSRSLKSGMDLYVAGFPAATRVLTKSIFVFREGKVSANSNKTFDAGYSLVYSNDTLPGMSGGAVLNERAEVVAIHGRGDRERLSDNTLGGKTGFNVGIPIDRFVAIASNMGVPLSQPAAVTIAQTTSSPADDYVASAAQKYNNRDYRGALADYDRAIALKPKDAIAYNYRGVLKVKIQDFEGGLADYNRAIQIDANYGEAYSNRGNLKANKLKDLQGAMADYDLAIELSPKYAPAYSNRGILKVKNRDIIGGLADYNLAIQQDPTEATYYSYRAFLKILRGDRQGALTDFTRSIDLNPSNASVYAKRADHRFFTLKDRAGGLADLQQSAQLYQQQGNAEQYQKTLVRIRQWQKLNKKAES
ncbi:tetratricopeptide repeat-containing S1 family peptidase [Chamaesiphon polymorphus]|uniref:Serine protease n=1 Tax=Chamaesiphon polymorphus CCALA 037 TaxID=2107692 RepID=A0A2T1GD77_9CYAN|nr:tetratricopeptide repeat-containing serine protease family protein [Chamaesiphon polymorphus]PSB55374.1 serine protease [Chamaesiphon polymorphus CCALA 037]